MRAIEYHLTAPRWAACRVLSPFWRRCILSPLSGLRLADVAVPPLPGDDWVVVRTLLGGICGTDLAILAHKQPPSSILQAFSSMPLLLGHENVGQVQSVGPAVDKSWIGRRVCVEPTLSCVPRGIDPPCHCCADGRFGACESFGADGTGRYKLPPGTSIGYNRRTGGSWGERFVAHVSQLVSVPDGISDELAVLTDPLACSMHAAMRADLAGARQVLVYGAGVLGLGLIAALRALGYSGRIDAMDRSAYVRELAMAFGADEFIQPAPGAIQRGEQIALRTGATIQRVRFGNYMLSGGYDVAFDCVGAGSTLSECLKWTAARGQVVMVGTGHGGDVDLTPVWFRELTVLGAYGRQVESFQGRRLGTYQLVHELMSSGKLDVAAMLTHRFGLDDYRKALDVALWKGPHKAVKVAFDFRKQGSEGRP